MVGTDRNIPDQIEIENNPMTPLAIKKKGQSRNKEDNQAEYSDEHGILTKPLRPGPRRKCKPELYVVNHSVT